VRAELYGPDRLHALAREIAAESHTARPKAGTPLLARFAENAEELRAAQEELNRLAARRQRFSREAEWLFDNYHIIDDALREIRTDLPRGFYDQLPKLAAGPLAGWPRVYWLAIEIVAHTDSALEEAILEEFLRSYQEVRPLTIGELWAVPIMLRLVLVENLSRIARDLRAALRRNATARAWADEYVKGDGHAPFPVPDLDRNGTGQPPRPLSAEERHLVVAALQNLRGSAISRERLDAIEGGLRERGVAVEEALRAERERQAANQVTVGNCVTSIRVLSAIDWASFYEQVSLVEAQLRDDPVGVYERQDFATRDRYRQAVEELARGAQLDELAVARAVLDRCRKAPPTGKSPAAMERDTHVGHYLIGDGRRDFERELNYRPRAWQRSLAVVLDHARSLYFGTIGLVTAALLIVFVWYGLAATSRPGWAVGTLLFFVTVLPAVEIAVGIVNHLVTRFVPPRTLPKLDFSTGIPSDCPTFVVIPTLLNSPEGARRLVERLEIHYLANPDAALRFALLTDWADAPTEHLPTDDAVLEIALSGVAELNRRHAASGSPLFFLFHRRRLWNPSQMRWMGWERKRGKLSEFNRLVLGARDTTYGKLSCTPDAIPRVRFVITLDSDTHMPRDTARRLIATLAHPLNYPQFDPARRRVVDGYTILQPRIGFSLPAARRSRFTRLVAGSAGIDPYTTATSDVYQDLFGLGTFTGKGVYELAAFEAATGTTFPENHILSHDLIEGNFARCGLVSDIELIDDLPARYNAFARRDHRWVRGDWQLLPWLGPRVPAPPPGRFGPANLAPPGQPGAAFERVWLPNVLPLVERWKVLDNLRRSVTPIALVVLFVAGWTILPGSPWLWTLFGLAVPGLPLLLTLPSALRRLMHVSGWRLRGNDALWGLFATASHGALQVSFLAHQAVTLADAIVRTLWRVFVSHKHLLEWETAAATERRLGGRFEDFLRFMIVSPLAALLVGGFLVFVNPPGPPASLIVLIPWLIAPAMAYWVSQPVERREEPLSAEEVRAARRVARKTWEFFEQFVGREDNGLPPDNYQEEPREVVAHRTSPTNIGLSLVANLAAHDFGYISLTRALERVELALATMARMDRHRGHFFNWYDTQSLRPLEPRYVSTVDSGNLLAGLVALRRGLEEKLSESLVGGFWLLGLEDTLRLAMESAPANSAVRGQLRDFGELLTDEPEDLPGWADRLGRLDRAARAFSAGAHEGESARWIGRLADEVGERVAEFAAVAPWVALLGEALPGEIPADVKYIVLKSPSVRGVQEAVRRLEAQLSQRALSGSRWPRLLKALRDSAVYQISARIEQAMAAAARFEAEMDFRLLYNATRHLYTIGLSMRLGALDSSHYDLLASESALTSYLTIARGEADRKHWFQLARPVTNAGGSLALVSWGGTMFEYLMPRLFLRTYPQTLLAESRHAVVERQIDYAGQRGVPWGISESGYNKTDESWNYQYQSFGVPGLGLKRGLEQDLVVAPYATLMAVMVAPHEVIRNLAALTAAGAEGPYGYYEAIDYTPSRVLTGKSAIIRSYMAHHQGMSFLSLANALFGDPFPRRFHAEPSVRSAELLLQERVPWDAPRIEVAEVHAAPAAEAPAMPAGPVPMSRRLTTPDTAVPRTHWLSNGRYSVMLTNAGSGRSIYRDLDVTRWREDRTRDHWGTYIYVRDMTTATVWAAGYQPVNRPADVYEVTFAIDKAEFRRRDGDVETVLDVTVSPEKPAEIRRVTLTNRGATARDIELTSYVELAIAPHAADRAHPAFQKLFLETEFAPGAGALLCRRRPRQTGDPVQWAVHSVASDSPAIGDVEYETDRGKFIGRGRTLASPQALDGRKLTNTAGPVLDPVFGLRRRVSVPAGGSVAVTFMTGVADSREMALALADRYAQTQAVSRSFELAWARGQTELEHLGIAADEAHTFQRLAGHLVYANPALRAPANVLRTVRPVRDVLSRHGISGDRPILLVTIGGFDELPLLRQLLRAHGFWRENGLAVDLVVLNERAESYNDELAQQIKQAIAVSPDREWLDRTGGVLLRRGAGLPEADRLGLLAAARVVIPGKTTSLDDLLTRQEQAPDIPPEWTAAAPAVSTNGQAAAGETSAGPSFVCRSDYGGFTPDGREYGVIVTPTADLHCHAAPRLPPAPWVNVLANPSFGCLVSDCGLSCTWSQNSQTNRLTPWSNDPVTDPPSEVLYVRDESTGEVWTPTPRPLGPDIEVRVRHGQGYTSYDSVRGDLAQTMTVFVPPQDPLKVIIYRVTNRSGRSQSLTLTYYAELVLGGQPEETAMHGVTDVDATSGAVFAWNPARVDYGERVAFADVLHRPRSVTADRTEFLGRNGSPAAPAALGRQHLADRSGGGLDPCFAVQTTVEVPAGGEREVVFLLGEAEDPVAARALLQRYREPGRIHDALTAVGQFWDELLGAVQVETPDPAVNVMVNRWLPYQVVSCRLWGRTAFYQSGGAFGFRDQLQDVMALSFAAPKLTRAQILLAASRQFVEGDVQHWWHPPRGAGVRTHCSDDLLWLTYVAMQYARVSGDGGLWDEVVPFLEAPTLTPGQEDDYRVPQVSAESASVYEHCARAVDARLTVGPHGLPLIGSCDWNDGFNRVGLEGRGESVWMVWFLLSILPEFAVIADRRGEAQRAARYREHAERLRSAVEAVAWDGDWYLRAFFDDGTPLGSHAAGECKIDSLAQTWALMSGGAKGEHARRSLDAVFERLVRPADGLVALFMPPFDHPDHNPGYIAGYLPGIRENGGQYTHGAVWCVFATAGDSPEKRHARMGELLTILNPVNAATTGRTERYKLEPYVLAGDVYSQPPHVGRGGWSWYTGSAAWFYRGVIEVVLGLAIRGNQLVITPCLPASWENAVIRVRYRSAQYEVRIQGSAVSGRSPTVSCDGETMSEGKIAMHDDGRQHVVEVKLG
jgi:cyclic beta-1,2-glucan synthetase